MHSSERSRRGEAQTAQSSASLRLLQRLQWVMRSSASAERLDDPARAVAVALQQMKRHAARAFRTHAGEPAQRLLQGFKCGGIVHSKTKIDRINGISQDLQD